MADPKDGAITPGLRNTVLFEDRRRTLIKYYVSKKHLESITNLLWYFIFIIAGSTGWVKM